MKIKNMRFLGYMSLVPCIYHNFMRFLGFMSLVPCEVPRTTFDLWVGCFGAFVTSWEPGVKGCLEIHSEEIAGQKLCSRLVLHARPRAIAFARRFRFSRGRSHHTIIQCRPMPFVKAGERPTSGTDDRQRAASPFTRPSRCNGRGAATYTAQIATNELTQETTSKHA